MNKNMYKILDSGDRMKLEQIGPYKIIRPAPEACYPKTLPELWKENIDAIYIRSSEGGGHWEYQNLIPQQFPITLNDFQTYIKLTGFGHIGFFPEHYPLWNFITHLKIKETDKIDVLNLFAYTGLSTVACIQKKFHVCHVDSSKGMIDLAKMNLSLNNLDEKSVRWIVEDARKFVGREIKRGKMYKGFILDPPSFGRGPKNEVWKLEQHISTLFENIMTLCDSSPLFVIFTCYSSDFTPLILERILRTYIRENGIFLSGELTIKEVSGHLFSTGGSCGIYVSKEIYPDNLPIFSKY